MTTDRPSTLAKIAAAVEGILRGRRALDHAELLEHLTADGIRLGTRPEDTLDEVLHDDWVESVVCLEDGRHAHLPSLLEGMVFTHRLTPEEAAADAVFTDPDLMPLVLLTDETTQLVPAADGGAIREVLTGFDPDDALLTERGIPDDALPDSVVWLLPQGTFAELGVTEGDLVGFRCIDGAVRVEGAVVLDPDAPADFATRLDALFGADESGEPLPNDSAVLTIAASLPTAFLEPAVPLTELFGRHGYVLDVDHVAPPGFDFEAWRIGKRVGYLGLLHGLDEDGALTVLALLRMHEALSLAVGAADSDEFDPDDESDSSDDFDDELASWCEVEPALLRLLADAPVAKAFLHEAVGPGTRGAVAMGVLAETLAERAAPETQPALAWLQARSVEHLGHVDTAETHLERAHRLDPGFTPAAEDLARFASDRGDLEGALALLGGVNAHSDDPLHAFLSGLRPLARHDLGRNDRCWCGSGRKYKQCHLGSEVPPLEDRGGWLIRKASTYADGGTWRALLLELAQIRAHHVESETALLDALDDPLVMDVALFEGGAFTDFLSRRGHLLPDDERLMADQWLLVDRSVFEVEAIDPGVSVSVRDVRTGDRHQVRERAASRRLRPGDMLCARVVPVGSTFQFMGGVEPVTLRERDELVAILDDGPNPSDLVGYLSRRFAPPVIRNTEGHDLIVCEIDLTVPDPAALAAKLTARFGDPDDDPPTWHEHVVTHGMERLRATFVLDSGRLHIETNSNERADDALALVEDLAPGVRVASDERTPMADLREAMSRAPGALDGDAPRNLLDDPPPELRDEMEQLIVAYEEQWLDESIPALDGLTPRQAAADPTRRGDLGRLLDSFGPPGQFGMDPDRLREALDLHS